MTYRVARNDSIRRALGRRIEAFAQHYRPGLPTIILLPSGMGSQLNRSKRRYTEDADLPLEYDDTIWMDWGIWFNNDALLLEIQDSGRDVGDHLIIPDGPLDFVVTPYDGTKRFIREERGWNYICFGFDWRRPVTESASYLETFLVRLGRRVEQLKKENPLPNTTLFCHSMGGLVATTFLSRLAARPTFNHADIKQWLSRVVTVATPFYGTSTHLRRYYKGQSALNRFHSATTVARITGSLPGPYILLYPDQTLYQRDSDKLNKSSFPLERYPMRDSADETIEVDPFASESSTRYPKWVSTDHLKNAREIRRIITKPLPNELSKRMFHIRSGLVAMPIEQKWSAVNGSKFDPERNAYPVMQSREGPGDGTVPAWSTRLVGTPLSQVYDLSRARKHSDLAEHRETLEVLAALVQDGKFPSTTSGQNQRLGIVKAPNHRMNALIDDVVQGKITRNDQRASDYTVWRRFIEEANLC